MSMALEGSKPKLNVKPEMEPRTKDHGSLSDSGRNDEVKREYCRRRVPSLSILMTAVYFRSHMELGAAFQPLPQLPRT